MLSGLVFFGVVLLSGCTRGDTGLSAILTLKDGTHFSGTVLRRESGSITVKNGAHETRTFLDSELADIKYLTPENGGGAPGAPGASGVEPAPSFTDSNAVSNVVFPAGTEFSVVSNGYLDSCCVPIGAFSVGFIDQDVHAGGKVALPRGASVTIMYMDKTSGDGRITMKFELGSADFGGRHYIMSSVKGGLEPGAVVSFTGAKEGTPEAKARGVDVHLDDRSFMVFKAATPTSMRLSQ